MYCTRLLKAGKKNSATQRGYSSTDNTKTAHSGAKLSKAYKGIANFPTQNSVSALAASVPYNRCGSTYLAADAYRARGENEPLPPVLKMSDMVCMREYPLHSSWVHTTAGDEKPILRLIGRGTTRATAGRSVDATNCATRQVPKNNLSLSLSVSVSRTTLRYRHAPSAHGRHS